MSAAKSRPAGYRGAMPNVVHESHIMRRVRGTNGELHCLICELAPWMPLIENECQSGIVTPAMREALLAGTYTPQAEQLTLEDVREAIRMRDEDGASTEEIGERFERGASSIAKSIRAFERGIGRLAEQARRETPTTMRDTDG